MFDGEGRERREGCEVVVLFDSIGKRKLTK